jgi:hypothetical protein
MIAGHFNPVTLPPVKTDLIDASGRATSDLRTAFQFVENPTPDSTLIFQEKDDLLHWIYENYPKASQDI